MGSSAAIMAVALCETKEEGEQMVESSTGLGFPTRWLSKANDAYTLVGVGCR